MIVSHYIVLYVFHGNIVLYCIGIELYCIALVSKTILGVCGEPCPWGEWLGLWRAVSLGGMAASMARRVPGNMIATSNGVKGNGEF